MRPIDLWLFPLAALWRQKLRTTLTTLGVVFGSFVLAASLSVGEGVQETITRYSRRSDISRRVDVSPKWTTVASKADVEAVKVEGKMSEARRGRLRKILADQKQREAPADRVLAGLDEDRLARLAAIPHVARALPVAYHYGFALFEGQSELARIFPARPDDAIGPARMVAGRFFNAPDEHALILSEHFAYRLGLVDDAQLEGLIGRPLRLEFRRTGSGAGLRVSLTQPARKLTREQSLAIGKVQDRLPAALETLLPKSEAEALAEAMTPAEWTGPEVYSEEFPVVGVARDMTEDEAKKRGNDSFYAQSDLIMPYLAAADLAFKLPSDGERGVDSVVLLVDEEKNVKEVAERVSKLGAEPRAAIEFIQRERFMYLLIFGGMTFVAGVALLVSALGIANTMLMSVMERTREIGIMKAVGADNRHLQLIFLVEGTTIGGFGGAIGLLLAWSASFPGDTWVRAMVLRDIKIDLEGSIFVFPPWISLSVLGFTVLITTLAALYPARHAARVDPVKALRHE